MHEAVEALTMHEAGYLRYIVAAPLAGMLINLCLGARLSRFAVGAVACAGVLVSFILSIAAFAAVSSDSALADHVYTWIQTGSSTIDVTFVVDPLSAVMCLIITGVGFLIHVYSTGYMAHDDDVARYFAYLNLFTASMLVLVLADSLVVMFVGWEGVGLCSYLLIGFWYEDPDKAKAGMKAFVVNRVGDAGFLLGAFLLWWALPAAAESGLEMTAINEGASSLSSGVALAAALLLFVGATGKSAQIPLFVWLPDAMAGPTPVSALIHAATMVTAGVYMVARLNGLYLAAPDAMMVVAYVGAATALVAATVGITQNDIKKVLAYSTVSQLGYMFLGLGVGAFSAAIFHVMTHAFFKALLFLGAGSVIHAMSDEQDIRAMGGLRHKLPITFATFVVGTAAIAGVPGLSGFFSKDEILASTFDAGHYGLWVLGLMGAAMTAFYMTRLVVLTFFGEFRGGADAEAHVHESPTSMTSALTVLAVLSVVGGYVGIPHALGGHNAFGSYLSGVVGAHTMHLEVSTELLLMLASIGAAFAGIGAAVLLYRRGPQADESLSALTGPVYRSASRAYYVDEAYDATLVKGTVRVSDYLWRLVDVGVIDAIANGVGTVAQGLGGSARRWATGNVSHYALTLLVGFAALVAGLALEILG